LVPRAPAQGFNGLWWLTVLRSHRTTKTARLIDDLVELAVCTGNAAAGVPQTG